VQGVDHVVQMTVSMAPNDIVYYELESEQKMKNFLELVTKKPENPPVFSSL